MKRCKSGNGIKNSRPLVIAKERLFLLQTGSKAFKFQITGKNASSGSYTLATDYFRLIYQSPDVIVPPPGAEPLKYEAENLATTVSPETAFPESIP